jgi:hypothetical protein
VPVDSVGSRAGVQSGIGGHLPLRPVTVPASVQSSEKSGLSFLCPGVKAKVRPGNERTAVQ